ncbi:universal stress protein [Streptomyces sp. SID4948]|uniref:universal stress protein n=1 Tax=Streptomyces sp. SID4948 TaxID=2690287 RepID=UPI00136B3761|nr:universal stress protein [Streptomyces sp. SID4948]MYS25085.1 universal stress protein [Streptomyces sp. SID4948]
MAQGGRVVVGVSGSLRSLAALHRAVDEARRRDAELMAVLAWTVPGGEPAYRRNPCPSLLTVCEEAAAERLEQAFRDAFGGPPAGVRLRLVTARGEPAAALTELAHRPEDLLVISTGRRGLLPRLFHGGVSRHCLARARCPVLAVPPSELMHDLGRTTGVLDALRLGHPA